MGRNEPGCKSCSKSLWLVVILMIHRSKMSTAKIQKMKEARDWILDLQAKNPGRYLNGSARYLSQHLFHYPLGADLLRVGTDDG